MITRPTTEQLIDVVRRELTEHVAPAVQDPQVATSLQMIDHILCALAARAGHELGWMAEEMDAIAAIGGEVAGSDVPGAAAVRDALTEFLAGRSASLHGSDVIEDYNRATEVLSRCVEATFAETGELRDSVNALLDHRLAHEMEVIGPDFQLVGRS